MAIFNTNEFLRKTFSKTIFGTAALRPEAVCADGFTLSIQASGMHYCIPNEDLSDGNYSKVELSYLSEEVEEFLPFAEDDEAPLATVYGYVPVETVDAVLAKHGGIAVGSFYMVTNGKAVDKMADLAMASLEWWAYCDEKDDYMCGLCISSDNFHEVIPYESKSILSGLKYNRNDKVTDFHLAYLLNEGRAKNLDSNIYKKREPHVDKLEYEFNKTGDIDFYSGELYLNAIGDVVSGCDWSYKSQKKYRFGNVMNKNWLENISNSELYIAS